jgi:molybdate transport system substrate-binding protein
MPRRRRRRRLRRTAVAFAAAALVAATPAVAATVRVAVAANFAPVLEEIAPAFAAASGHRLLVSTGSTGKLAAQVEQGAPFDVLLAGDAERPLHLVRGGHALAASRFTYARGRLVLWSARAGRRLGPQTLRRGDFAHLAIASPQAAPYGAAALEAMRRLGVLARLEPKLVRGESIGQTFSFVASGAAELGFVARSQLADGEQGTRWLVPASLHAPIEQQAVLLVRTTEPAAARSFLAWLRGGDARRTIERFGYELP